jgi:alpha-amylase
MAVLMSNGGDGWKWMTTGHPNIIYSDSTGHITIPVVTNNDGWGEFMCVGGKVSVWLPDKKN